ncbi:MAG: 4Fe-4S binding protein [Dorea sp.]|nr:4Fe-4S binding protein [Dorea sp.]MDY2813783.1 4Fe-4S binding protein [Dorea sp.]
MIRKIIQINEEKCNGCGLCANACHEGAIDIIDGKAKLVREHFCDGLGDCLPECPTGAITFVEREAPEYDEAAVARAKQEKLQESELLRNWPVQIKLAPVQAPYFDGANLLIAADCSAYAYASFHKDFVKGRVTLIGCPKLDVIDYSEKLTQILQNNSIASVTVVRMEVPCCGGIEYAVNRALQNSGKFIPRQVITIGIKGERKGGRADVQEY